jgi:hypothetical protein
MTLRHKETGTTLEFPPPDAMGSSVVLVNGNVVEHVLYSDSNGGGVTISDGTAFTPKEWVRYVAQKLEKKEWI